MDVPADLDTSGIYANLQGGHLSFEHENNLRPTGPGPEWSVDSEDVISFETKDSIDDQKKCMKCGQPTTAEDAITCTECHQLFCDNCYNTGEGDGCHCHGCGHG